MKVLLFVQTGDGRPKCVGRTWPFEFTRYGIEAPRLKQLGEPPRHGSHHQARVLAKADRWWLVECENADAGRFVIANAVKHGGIWTRGDVYGPCAPSGYPEFMGRILASGGKEAP